MADDHDALLAQHETQLAEALGLDLPAMTDTPAQVWHGLLDRVRDLAAALRESQANYLAALDIIDHVVEGWDAKLMLDRPYWYRDPVLADDGEQYGLDEMSDRHWRVFCHAAQRATHGDHT